MKIHFLHNYGKEFKALLKKDIPEQIEIDFGELTENRDVEIIVGGRPTETDIKSCKKLKKLIIPYAGISKKTKKVMKKYPDIDVHNLHHNSLSVAEYAATFMLSAAKDIIPAHELLKKDNWRIRYGKNPSLFIAGKNVLLLGFGEIARNFIEFTGGMRLNYLAVNHSGINRTELKVKVYPVNELKQAIPQADFIICTLPLTSETKGLFKKREFKLMKKTAILVNVGRAKIFKEEDLYYALENNFFKAAYFDVWYNYPRGKEEQSNCKPTNLDFSKLSNFYFSPHRASGLGIPRLEEMRTQKLIEYFNLYLQNKELPHKVDLEKGY